MAKNPILEKKFNDGFARGVKVGFEQGKYSACVYFADKFDGLENIPGIGPKIMEKIVKHFGAEYFKEVDSNGQQIEAKKKVEKVIKASKKAKKS